MKFKDNEVSTHPSADDTDPGFALKGYKLRWISPQVESRRAGRMWQPLKVSMLPDGVLKRLKESNSAWLNNAGDLIRRIDLVLSFAPHGEVEKKRRQVKEQQTTNEAVFRGKVSLGNGVSTEKDNTIEDERIEPSEKFK
jgi:hypothetical protein